MPVLFFVPAYHAYGRLIPARKKKGYFPLMNPKLKSSFYSAGGHAFYQVFLAYDENKYRRDQN